MHIIIAIITALAGLVWALNSLQNSGVDLNGFNPFYWLRRRKWEQQIINPLYAITSPRELAALLAFAVLRQGGDPTEEQKAHLLRLYVDDLRYKEAEAPEIYTVASHMLGTDPNYADRIRDIAKPALENMSDEQKHSIVKIIAQIRDAGGSANGAQRELADKVAEALHPAL